MRNSQRLEFLDGVGTPNGRGKVMIADQQKGADAGLREADDAAAPFTLKSGRRRAVLIGIPGKDDQINFFRDGRFNDGIEGFEKIQHAQRQARFRVMAAIVGHVNMRVGKVQKSHILIVE